jgi:hypothetical protein
MKNSLETSSSMDSKEQYFASQQSAMDTIYADPEHGLASLFNRLSDKDAQRLFSGEEEIAEDDYEFCSTCIDEGITLSNAQLPAARFAGSGILLGEQRAKELWRDNDITKVTAHVGCGAAMLYCREQGMADFSQEQADQHVAEILQQWATDEGLEFEYISQLSRPGFHTARGVFVDATQSLKADAVTSLPRMFQVTAHAEVDEVVDNIKLAYAIATGDHGLGKLITADQPFIVGFVGSDEDEPHFSDILSSLTAEGWVDEQQGKVVVQVAIIDTDSEPEDFDELTAAD